MDNACLQAISKYIKSDYVIKCLELAGYTTLPVLKCLNDERLNEIEDFVRYACSNLPENECEQYVSSLFSKNLDHFKFPGGVRCGLLLAVSDISKGESSISSDVNHIRNNSHFEEKSSQTQLTSHDMVNVFPTMNFNPMSPQINLNITEPALMSNTNPNQMLAVPQSMSPRDYSRGYSIVPASQSMSERSPNLERLKQHSATSIIRLTSRQYSNALLVKGVHFDMDMEWVTSIDGTSRATGIFYCHLCKERKERSSAVRFSIARNRYPVVSNVLSHLKTHFQCRTQRYPAHSTEMKNDSSEMSQIINGTMIKDEYSTHQEAHISHDFSSNESANISYSLPLSEDDQM